MQDYEIAQRLFDISETLKNERIENEQMAREFGIEADFPPFY